MEDKQILLKWNTHHTTFNHIISRLRHKSSYTDVTLACNGKFYSVHKFVLAICSEYFSEILEITECTAPMIILTDMQCFDLEILLDYMYTGKVNVQKNKITSLMKAAEFLRVKGLTSHEEEPTSLSCSIVLKNPSSHLMGIRTDKDKYMCLSSRRSCTSPMQTLKGFEKQVEKNVKELFTTDEREETSDIEIKDEILCVTDAPDNISSHLMGKRTGEDKSIHLSYRRSCTSPLQSLQNSEKQDEKEGKNLSTTDEREDVSDIEILALTDAPDNSPSDIEEVSCLPMPELNDSDDSTSTERFSDAVAEKQIPLLKRRRIDTGRSPAFSSSRPCKLMRDPGSSMYYLETLTMDKSYNSNISTPHNQGDGIEKQKSQTLAIDKSCCNNISTPHYKAGGLRSGEGHIFCKQENCNEGFKTLDCFRNHLTYKHGENHPKIVSSFKTWEDLQKWKKEFEVENVVNFRYRKHRTTKNLKISYYQCNRSSCFLKKSLSTGKRKRKAVLEDGAQQISTVCTAGLIITEEDGSFHVTAYPTHANHPLDNLHKKCLRLPETLKNEYIKQIKLGVPLHHIVAGINEEVKEQYGISYDKLFYLKKKIDARTIIPTDKSLLSLSTSNANVESDGN